LQEKSSLPIERAKIKLLVTIDTAKRDTVTKYIAEVEAEKTEGSTTTITCLIEPHFYREIDQATKAANGKVEVLVHSVKPESDTKFDEKD
jgi:ribosome maturation protein Sdo1